MNIKSLILGSAAAFVAVSGARAADAVVVAEPVPMDYVRVCAVYGAGYFYIPGTETCLSIGGEVRYQINASTAYDGWRKAAKGRIDVNAKSETEWGTLRGYIRLDSEFDPQNQVVDSYMYQALGVQFDPLAGPAGTGPIISRGNLGTDGFVSIDHAIIELGGLRIGYTESAWAQTQDGGVTDWGSHGDDGLFYGYQQRNLIAYTFKAGNGFFGTLSLEDDGNRNYMPDIVAKVGVNQGWGGVWAKVGYDEDIAPAAAAILGARFAGITGATGLSGVDGWAASAGVHINVPNMAGSSLRVIGFYANNANAYSVGSRWSVLASYQHTFSPMVTASVGAQYFGDTNYAAAGNPSAWQVEGVLVLTPVENFVVRAEINHFKATGATGVTSGWLRFSRFF